MYQAKSSLVWWEKIILLDFRAQSCQNGQKLEWPQDKEKIKSKPQSLLFGLKQSDLFCSANGVNWEIFSDFVLKLVRIFRISIIKQIFEMFFWIFCVRIEHSGSRAQILNI